MVWRVNCSITKGEFRLSNLDFAFDLETPLANISLAVPSVFIKGVDTFKTLVAFKSPKEENLTIVTDSDIEMGSIVVGGNFVLTLLPGRLVERTVHTEPLVVEFNGEISVEEPKIAAQTLIALSKKSFTRAHIIKFLSSEVEALKCAASMLWALKLFILRMSIQEIHTPKLSGFFDKGLDQLAQEGFSLFATLMKAPLMNHLPGLSQSVIRDLVNKYIAAALSERGHGTNPSKTACNINDPIINEGKPRNAKPNFLDFESPTVQQVRKGIAETLGNTSNPFVGMNAVLEGW